MNKKLHRGGSRPAVGTDPVPVDSQQARLVSILSRRAGEPVTYDELRDAGIELPASVVSELELAGIEVDRCATVAPDGRPVKAVRLPLPVAPATPSQESSSKGSTTSSWLRRHLNTRALARSRF